MTEHKNILINGIGQRAEGLYKVAVVDAATEEVVYESPWGKNLILNQGMEQVVSREWCDCFTHGICGVGTSPNSIDSESDTAAQSGTTVENTGATIDFTTDAEVGDMIKWDSSEEARITSITDANTVEVTPSQTVVDGAYVIWKTARVGLQSETKRSNTYLVGTGNCGTTQSGTTLQNRRTYDFSEEVGPVTFTEVGVGWSNSGSTTVFSRILLDTPVSLIAGQKLRLVYQLDITLSPSTPVVKNLPVGGWPIAPSVNTDGQEQIQNLCISSVLTANGGTSAVSGIAVLDPGAANSVSTGRMFCVSTNSSALQSFGTSVSRATTAFLCSVAPTNAAYTPLSFQLDVSSVFQVADGVSNNIRSVILGGKTSTPTGFPYDTTRQAFVFLFDQDQVKTNTQTLTFTVRFTWSRVLA